MLHGDWLTLAQAARYCGYDKPAALYKALQRGKVFARRPDAPAPFLTTDLDRFCAGLPPFRHGVESGSEPGLVYFFEAVGAHRVKIGWTSGMAEKRRDDVQGMCPFPLRILATTPGLMADERRLHAQFAGDRVHGEWFHMSDALCAHIARLK